MYTREIPTLNKLMHIANNTYNYSTPFDEYNENKLYRLIHDYYSTYSDIHTLEYEISDDKRTHAVKTLLGTDSNNEINIDNICVKDSIFVEYDEDMIDLIGFEVLDETTNNLTDIVYENDTIYVGKTDFKSYMAVSDLLVYELVDAYKNIDNIHDHSIDDFPVRNKILPDLSSFKQPVRPRGSTSGGVIIANTTDGWKLILGQRSQKSNINRGKVSIFPNGKIHYDDFIKNAFLTTLRREFTEELFNENSKGNIFFDEYITTEPVSMGWNLRDGDLSVGYALIINSSMGYDIFKNTLEKNKEINNIIEVPIMDFDKISETITFDNMSGAPIATVCESLRFIDNSKLYPDLPYDIKSSKD